MAVLATAAAGTSGCDLFGEPDPPPEPDPLEPLRAQTQALADQYSAAITAAPDLAERLTPLRDAHLSHVTELTKIIGTPPPSAPASPAAGSSGAGSPGQGSPADPAAIIAALRTAEEAGQRDAVAACLAAPGPRAALVGSIAACRSTHLEVLK